MLVVGRITLYSYVSTIADPICRLKFYSGTQFTGTYRKRLYVSRYLEQSCLSIDVYPTPYRAHFSVSFGHSKRENLRKDRHRGELREHWGTRIADVCVAEGYRPRKLVHQAEVDRLVLEVLLDLELVALRADHQARDLRSVEVALKFVFIER